MGLSMIRYFSSLMAHANSPLLDLDENLGPAAAILAHLVPSPCEHLQLFVNDDHHCAYGLNFSRPAKARQQLLKCATGRLRSVKE